MKKSIGVLLVFCLVAIYSCSKEVDSREQFIFKPAPSKNVVAKVNGKMIKESELVKGIESDIFEAQTKVFEIRMNRLKAMFLEKFMNLDSRKKGLSNDQYMDKYIASKASVTKKEVQKFIKERKIPKTNLTEALRVRIKQFLLVQKKKKLVDSWMSEQLKKNKVEVYLSKPQRPVFDVNVMGAPFKGDENAKVTVVEFSDFQCPYCARGRTIMEGLRQKYGKKIKIVYKTYPLPFHNHAQKAAEAAHCALAQSQNHFWGLHDKMFDDQTKLAVKDIKASAKSLGIDMKKFNDCLDKGTMAAAVKKSLKDGEHSGVKSTPTYFVNGQMINGAQPIDIFSELVDQELKK